MDAPTTNPARLRRREATVGELLGHAERLVSEEGLEGLTMHRLAAVHGVRVAALYRYWPSKDALLVALLGRVFDRMFTAIREARAAVGDRVDEAEAPLARLVASAFAYLRFAEAQPESSALLTRMLAVPRPTVSDDDVGQPGLLGSVLALGEEIGRDLELARDAGLLSDGDDPSRAVLLWTSLQGLVAARKMSRFAAFGDLGKLEHELVRALFSGWGARAPTLAKVLDAAAAAARGGRSV